MSGPIEAVVFDVGKVLVQWERDLPFRSLIADPAERDWFMNTVIPIEWHGEHAARDIYRAISTGLDGTPMPGFDGVYDENGRWDLTAYVFYLRGKAAGVYGPEEVLK